MPSRKKHRSLTGFTPGTGMQGMYLHRVTGNFGALAIRPEQQAQAQENMKKRGYIAQGQKISLKAREVKISLPKAPWEE